MKEIAIIAAGQGFGTFVAGLVIGAGLGLLLAPLLRSWLAWREWLDASREARLTDAVLERMERELDRSSRQQARGASEPKRSRPRDGGAPAEARKGGPWASH